MGSIKPDAQTRINYDLYPISYFLSLLFWSSHFESPLKPIFYRILGIKWHNVLSFLAVFIILILAVSSKKKSIKPPLIILFLSFLGMSSSILLINAFQVLYGYAYQAVAAIVTAYMSGLVSGSLIINLNYHKIRRPDMILRSSIFGLVAILITTAVLIKYLSLPLFAFLVALPLGMAFPLAVKISEGKNPGALAGLLYGMDLLGGALAAFLITIFFIPVFGIINTVQFLILLGLGILFLI